jgi:hypothetical protein
MTVLIALTTAGSSTGPFNLYSNTDNYAAPFETNVPKASLVAGYLSVVVPAGTTVIQVRSLGTCTNSINIPIDLLTTSTSSTSTTSTTTTTVAPSSTTTTSSTTTVPTTSTTTTTTIPTLECVEVTNTISVTGQNDCLGTIHDITTGVITANLVTNAGVPSVATNDVIITAQFLTKQCGDTVPITTFVDITILTGTSSATYSYTKEQLQDCGQGVCELETDVYQGVVSVEPSLKYSLCGSTTTTSSTTTSTSTTTVPTTTAACVKPAGLTSVLLTSDAAYNSNTYDFATMSFGQICTALQGYCSFGGGGMIETIATGETIGIAIGNSIYTTDSFCAFLPNGNYVVGQASQLCSGSATIISVLNGIITAIDSSCTYPATTTTTTSTTTTTVPTTTSTTTSSTTAPTTTTTTQGGQACSELEIYPPLTPGTTHTVVFLTCEYGTQETINIPYGGTMGSICVQPGGMISDNGAQVNAQTYPTQMVCIGNTTTTTTTTTTAAPATNYRFYRCIGDGVASVIVNEANLVNAGMAPGAILTVANTIEVSGSGNLTSCYAFDDMVSLPVTGQAVISFDQCECLSPA